MLDTLVYKFKNRNSKKNLKKEIERLDKRIKDLRMDALGNTGWIYFGDNPPKDESLRKQINDIRAYLDIAYSDSKLEVKPKEGK